CGDGIVDDAHPYNEQCDDGEDNADEPNACRTNCKLPTCGDGIIDDEDGEVCDDGPNNSDLAPNACRNDCQPARCGDGVIDDGEECDGENFGGKTCGDYEFATGSLTCTSSCTIDTSACTGAIVCGDGILSEGEECDDGNQDDGDGCSSECKL